MAAAAAHNEHGCLLHAAVFAYVLWLPHTGGDYSTYSTAGSDAFGYTGGCHNKYSAACWLPCALVGEAIGALSISEPNAGSDAVSMRTRADRKGNRYVLNGTKMWCTNGPKVERLAVLG
jgi:alkylation response protein AidB-like acyl-CoA dehydrogenase